MKYRVLLLPRARQDLEEIHDFIAETQQQPLSADRWLDGIQAVIEKLASNPRRGRVVPEQALFGPETVIRQVLFHRHRILYAIVGTDVQVLQVRRGTRRNLLRDDF